MEERRRIDRTNTRMSPDMTNDDIPMANTMSSNTNGMRQSKMTTQKAMKTYNSMNDSDIEKIYSMIDKHMQQGLLLHNQLADCFCFLGLQGFKRMAEYQYMNECADLRKLHKYYIDNHYKVLPICDTEIEEIIPNEFRKYTSFDVDENSVSRYTKLFSETWTEWEEKTKELLEHCYEKLQTMGMYSDAEFIREFMKNVEDEQKKVVRMQKQVQGSGYHAGTIHAIQRDYKERYRREPMNPNMAMENRQMREYEPHYRYDDYEEKPYRRDTHYGF